MKRRFERSSKENHPPSGQYDFDESRPDPDEAYREDHELVLQRYYEKNKFLGNENLVITVVVPIAAELDSGNLWRMIESLGEIDDATPNDSFEVLFVINNKAGEAGESYFQENQQTLEIFDAYNKALVEMTSTEEREVITNFVNEMKTLGVSRLRIRQLSTCLARGIRIHPVDASSPGKEVNLRESPYSYMTGAAKNIGGHIGTERKENGILDFKDADDMFPPDYFLNLAELATEKGKRMISFAIDIGFVFLPEVDPEVMTTPQERLDAIDYYVGHVTTPRCPTSIRTYIPIKGIHDYGDGYDTQISLDPRSYEQGPQLAMTGELFQANAGYPTVGGHGEDYMAVSLSLENNDDQVFFDGTMPSIPTTAGKHDTDSITNWKTLYKSERPPQEFTNYDHLLKLCADMYQRYEQNELFQKMLEREFNREVERRTEVINLMRNAVKVVLENRNPDSEAVEALFLETDYLERFIQDCADLSGSNDSEEVFSWIQNRFPVLYASPPQVPSYDQLVTAYLEKGDLSEFNPKDFFHVWRAAYFAEVKNIQNN
jgi:hypothetical protein